MLAVWANQQELAGLVPEEGLGQLEHSDWQQSETMESWVLRVVPLEPEERLERRPRWVKTMLGRATT